MSIFIALLRAINVAGRNKVAMSDLRSLCADLGLGGAKTLLQSGNLIFESAGRSESDLERLLEAATAKHLAVTCYYVVRGTADWDTVVAHNPFPKEAKTDPSHLLVVFLKAAPSAENVDALREAVQGPEIIRAVGKQLYAVFPDGIGRSKLTIPLIEKKLGTRGTGRNWNTVLKLDGLARKKSAST